VYDGVVEEVGDELIGPDHEPAGQVAGGAPSFEAFGFPDDRWLRGKLGDDLLDAAVITTGSEAYRRADGVAVIPLCLIEP
jgi:hypothetical protein